jgi:hypothetical protein
MLQWGRRLMATEIIDVPTVLANLTMLQWGRRLMATEMARIVYRIFT